MSTEDGIAVSACAADLESYILPEENPVLLAIDIGNTNIVCGFYDGKRLVTTLRIATNHARTSDESAIMLHHFMQLKQVPSISSMVVATVVPKLESIFRRMAKDYFQIDPLFVNSNLKLNITFDYPLPSEIGADRICDAVAAYDKFGGPTIVVDFGTATTFGVISENGVFIGGVIAPGIETSQTALAQKAAQLFKISFEPPLSPIGKSSEEAMKAGFYLGAVGQTDYIIESIANYWKKSPKVIATGGLAGLISPLSKYISEILPEITLEGLRLIHEMNRG